MQYFLLPRELRRLTQVIDLNCSGLSTVPTHGYDGGAIADSPRWEEAYVERARQTVMRNLNRPSIILWSLGDLRGHGRNHARMYEFIESADDSRPVCGTTGIVDIHLFPPVG